MRRIVLLLASIALAVIFVSGVALADSPTSKEDCKHGGYAKYGFKNQAQCIKAVKAPPDTTAPETTITAGPEQNSQSEMEAATFEFTSSEPNSTFECQAKSHTFGSAVKGENLDLWHPCTSPMTYSPLRDDTITFRVRAIDAAGNVDPTPAERLFYARREGPSIQITSGPEDRSTISADSVTFEWATDGVTPVDSRCSLRGPNGLWIEYFSPCSSPKTYQLTEDGNYFFGVFVEDATGNHNGLGTSFTVDTTPPADTVPPEITVTGPEGTTTRTRATYFLEANEPVTWDCTASFTPAGESEPRPEMTTGCYGGYMSWDVNTDGTYLFTFKATDAAGNTSTVTKTLILDRTVPT